jgi:hypothetical protein
MSAVRRNFKPPYRTKLEEAYYTIPVLDARRIRNEILEELGIHIATFNYWKKGSYAPKLLYKKFIAQKFNLPVSEMWPE